MTETDQIEPEKTAKRPTNWMAIYTAYCNGASIPELAEVFEIEEARIKAHAAGEGWAALRAKMPLVTNPAGLKLVGRTGGLPAETEKRFQEIQDNRTKNLKVFSDLREHLIAQVEALKDGTARVEKLFHNKGEVVRAEASPSPADWLNVATYARTVAEGTYRALGDFVGDSKITGDSAGAAATNSPQAAITIILPAAISAPREDRDYVTERQAKRPQVIDVQDLTTPATQPPPRSIEHN